MRIRDVIAGQINDRRDNGVYGSLCGEDILHVEVRPGCSEIQVDHRDGIDGEETVTLDAAPVMTEVINQLIKSESVW